MEVAALCLQSEQDVTEKQIEARLTPIRNDIAAIKANLKISSGQQPNAREGQRIPKEKNWFASNPTAVSVIVSSIVGAISVFVMVWQVKAPQAAQNEDERFWLKMDKHIADQLKEPLEGIRAAQQNQAGDLRELKGTVDVMAKILLPQALPQQLKKQAALNQQDFGKSVRETARLADVAAVYGVSIPSETVDQLSARMTNAPEEEVPFLLAAIINLKSVRPLKEMGLFDQVASASTPCIANPPQNVSGSIELVPGTAHVFKIENKEFKDCVQVLDGTFWDKVRFTRCLLIYHGGYVGWGFLFTDGSLFRIDLPERPTPQAKETLAKLLPQAGSLQTQLKP